MFLNLQCRKTSSFNLADRPRTAPLTMDCRSLHAFPLNKREKSVCRGVASSLRKVVVPF